MEKNTQLYIKKIKENRLKKSVFGVLTCKQKNYPSVHTPLPPHSFLQRVVVFVPLLACCLKFFFYFWCVLGGLTRSLGFFYPLIPPLRPVCDDDGLLLRLRYECDFHQAFMCFSIQHFSLLHLTEKLLFTFLEILKFKHDRW
jgi:hypothetical protein